MRPPQLSGNAVPDPPRTRQRLPPPAFAVPGLSSFHQSPDAPPSNPAPPPGIATKKQLPERKIPSTPPRTPGKPLHVSRTQSLVRSSSAAAARTSETQSPSVNAPARVSEPFSSASPSHPAICTPGHNFSNLYVFVQPSSVAQPFLAVHSLSPSRLPLPTPAILNQYPHLFHRLLHLPEISSLQ